MKKVVFVVLPLLMLFGCKSDPQPGQYPYPQPGQYPYAQPGQVPQAPVQPVAVQPVMPRQQVVNPAGTMPTGLIPRGTPLPPIQGTGAASPDELGRALTSAMSEYNTVAMLALFLSNDQLNAAIRCEPGRSGQESVEKSRMRLAEEIFAAWEKKETFTYVSVAPQDEITNLASGSKHKGCITNDHVALQKYVFSVNQTRNGRVHPGKRGCGLVYIGSLNRWFFIKC